MNPQRVSVIIPVYNAEATLQRALDSVRAQSQPPFEVICVDDNSRDGSVAMITRYDPQGRFLLRIIQQPRNNGPAAARNRGLEFATGEIIAFLDADDTWSPSKLALQLEAMQLHTLDLFGGYSALPSKRARMLRALDIKGPLSTHAVQLLPAMLSNPFHTSSVMVRRDPRVRFPDQGHLSEDYALWLQLIAAGWRCARHTEALSFMHKQAFGASGLSAQLWRMQRGELAALSAVGWPSRWRLLMLAIPVSCLKFGLRSLRNWLR